MFESTTGLREWQRLANARAFSFFGVRRSFMPLSPCGWRRTNIHGMMIHTGLAGAVYAIRCPRRVGVVLAPNHACTRTHIVFNKAVYAAF